LKVTGYDRRAVECHFNFISGNVLLSIFDYSKSAAETIAVGAASIIYTYQYYLSNECWCEICQAIELVPKRDIFMFSMALFHDAGSTVAIEYEFIRCLIEYVVEHLQWALFVAYSVLTAEQTL
jgi:hypothetical protein